MTLPTHLPLRSLLLACSLAATFAVHAGEALPATTSTTNTTVGTSTTTEAKLVSEFSGFLGGEAPARMVVSGLRQGTDITLESTTTTIDPTTGAPITTTTTTIIDPPTGTMGYGNVRIALRLAQAELNQLGITQPTAEALSAMLLGGDLNGTPVDGVLALRADGMGWGQIAKQYGTTVGQLMGKAPIKPSVAGAPAKTAGKPASAPRANGYIPSGAGKAAGSGIVAANGNSVGGSAKGQAQKAATGGGKGLVSAGAQPTSLAGVSHGGGHSNSLAPGQLKKN